MGGPVVTCGLGSCIGSCGYRERGGEGREGGSGGGREGGAGERREGGAGGAGSGEAEKSAEMPAAPS